MSPIPSDISAAQYISLKTFRKNGEGVSTAVWFAEDNGKLYVYSAKNAGKIKRVRNNSKVEVAVCNVKGVVSGPIVTGTAIVLAEDTGKYVHGLLNRKYTWKKRIMELGSSVMAMVHIRKASADDFLEITLE
jgi:uncharacterized protein